LHFPQISGILRKMKNSNSSVSYHSKYGTVLLSLLLIAVILIYTDTLTTPFIFDDINNIRDNPHIRIPSLSIKNLAWAGFMSPISSRPIANISFALNYYFSGYNLVALHLVNILIHLATGVFLFFLAKATLKTPALRSRYVNPGWIPLLTAFIWMVHPIQTQSVAFLVQRMNSLSAMFYILSMLLYVQFRQSETKRAKWSLSAGCILAGLLAIGSKEIAATLPAFIALYEWYFFQRLDTRWIKRHFLMLCGFMLLVVIISLIYLENQPVAKILSTYNNRDFTLSQRVLTEFRVVMFYIGLLLWPHPSRLNLDHDFPLSYALTNPITTLFSIAAIGVIIILAILCARREPLISFSILWFFGNLIIESSVIGLELVFEHRNYLPSTFATLAVVTLVTRYLKPYWLSIISLCVVGTLFTLWTYQRNQTWSDEIALYRDSSEKSPRKARPHNNLGAALSRQGYLKEAIEHYHTALRLKPGYIDAHYNLGYALAKQGNLKEGIYHFQQVLRREPKHVKAHNNMGVSLVLQKRYSEAIHHFRSALAITPWDADLHNNLGYALMAQGLLEQAIQQITRALELDPNHARAHTNLGLALRSRGDLKAARDQFIRALEISPNYAEARRNLTEIENIIRKPD
jgi:tetratricopeptide (TPR) repeat protein